MRAKIKFPSLSIYRKLVLTFLLFLLPLYALSLIMNGMGSDAVKDEVTESMVSRVRLYMNLLELDFDRIAVLQQEFINDEDLLQLSTTADIMPDYEKSQAILRLHAKLNLIKKSSEFIENVSAHIPLLDRTISSNARYVENFNHSEYKALFDLGSRYSVPFIHWQDRLFTGVQYRNSAVASRTSPIYVVGVELSKHEITKALQQFTIDGEGGAILFNDHADFLIASMEDPSRAQWTDKFSERSKAMQTEAHTKQIEFITMEEETYLVVSGKSDKLDSALIMYVPENYLLEPSKTFHIGFWLLSGASVLLIVLFSYRIYRLIHQPITALVRSFRKVEDGNLGLAIRHKSEDEFGYLYEHFNSMVNKLNVLVHEVYEQKYRARLSELKHLQSQINPHFLYNSFYLLYRMAKLQDYDNIIRFTGYLGDYFRFITRDKADEVALEAEAQYAKTYTDIQNFRFSARICVEFGDIPVDCADIPVPRLILQPIIENAYNHGLENKTKGGLIKIAFTETEERLLISIEDNGEAVSPQKLDELNRLLISPDDAGESTGISNVHRRLQIKYGARGGLRFSPRPDGGLRVDILIPLHTPQLPPSAAASLHL